MAAFPVVAFQAAPWFCSIVVVVGAHVNNCGCFRAVIAGENDDGVFPHVVFVEFFDELADDEIELMDEIAVGASLGFSLGSFSCK